MKDLFDFIKNIIPISEDSWSSIEKICNIIEAPKKAVLTKAGELPQSIYFLSSGTARGYITTENGTEYNKALFTKQMFFGALAALVKQNITQVNYQTLTKSKLIEIDYQKFLLLVESNPEINKLYIKILESIFLRLETRDIEMVTLNATERYLKLRERIPTIDKQFSQYNIASNIGITPIQLSRIRKKLPK